MFYDLISLYVIGQESTNVFVPGEIVNSETEGKFGVYDEENDVIYLYADKGKCLRTLIFFTKSKSKPNALVFNGYYELCEEMPSNELLLKYTKVIKEL